MIPRMVTLEFGSACLVAALSLFGLSSVWHYPEGSRIMPIAVMIVSTVLSLIWITQLLLSGKLRTDPKPEVDKAEFRRVLIVLTSLPVLIAGIATIGFFTSFFLMVPAIAWTLGYRNWRGLVLGTSIFCGSLYFVFKTVLNRPLPVEIWMLFGA